eukprot:CAMPEP_0177365906 /NCGR_PEP_ID=MMETSP0368-20130122/39575_1 /TAXON_ID=447022 ORGANISM="Scrippsiella hangoei-like, Strain SHHI-4" /NCGR_SAMPLE_ID=MMETSP0368 /ASSEMBLY_ACC=CAM_ASM_000363 /LENGTH=774 /DNA_ID=CAMNT_0018828869 /DNA_START=35 /DNA_END=2356 /DNA_ORIENTATION=-
MGLRLSRWMAAAVAGQKEDGDEDADLDAPFDVSGGSSSSSTEDPRIAAALATLQRAAAMVPGLLAWGRHAEAHQALLPCLQSLEEVGDLLKVEMTVLRILIFPTLFAVHQLGASRQLQLQLAFDASGLASVVASKATAKPELLGEFRGLLSEVLRFVAAVWFFTPVLANQPLDNNRFVLRLCATLAEHDGFEKELLSALAFCCVSAASAQTWVARHFSSDVLLAFSYREAREVGTTQVLAPMLLHQCHVPSTMTMLQRVLLFIKAWEQKFEDDAAMADIWLRAAVGLQHANAGLALTPAACLVSFFLGRASRSRKLGSDKLESLQGVLAWLRTGLQFRTRSSEDIIVRGFVASTAGALLASGQPARAWVDVAEAAMTFVCEVILPPSLMGRTAGEVQQHYYSPEGRFLIGAAETLARCVSELSPSEQSSLVLGPLESLCRRWSEGWDIHAASLVGQTGGILYRYGTSALLFMASVLRQVVDWEEDLGTDALLHFLRALSFVDAFREVMDHEHAAICTRLAQVGAGRPGFAEGLFWSLWEAKHRLPAAGSGAPPPEAVLGAVAVEELIVCDAFFPAVWPVVVACVRRSCEGGAWKSDAVPLAVRAHSLANVAFKIAGTAGRSALVKDYMSASVESFRAAPDEQVARVLAAAAGAISSDVAKCREQEENTTADDELVSWAMGCLSAAVLQCLEASPPEVGAAEGLFQAFAAVARFHEPASLPGVLYGACQLRDMLQRHEPLRGLWLSALIGGFAETARPELLRLLLDDFPDAAAAF